MSIARPIRVLALGAAFLFGLVLAAPIAPAEEATEVSAEFRKSLRQYLEIQSAYVSYGDNVAYQAANETLMQIAGGGIEVTEQVQQIVLEEAQAKFGDKFRDLDYLTELIAPVYAKHFDQKELDALVEFWGSPLGLKSLANAAQLNQETLGSIQQVTFGLSPAFHLAVDARLREIGYALDVQPDPNAPAAQ